MISREPIERGLRLAEKPGQSAAALSEFAQAQERKRDQDGHDLRDRLVLAHLFRGEDDLLVRRDGAQAGDEKFARDDQHDHPHRRHMPLDQADQRAGDQDFVGEGIEQLAQVGDEMVAPRDCAIEPIGQARDGEDDQRAERGVGPGERKRNQQ